MKAPSAGESPAPFMMISMSTIVSSANAVRASLTPVRAIRWNAQPSR
jgi:hypothetical protein